MTTFKINGIIIFPDPELTAKYGPLARVDAEERQKILDVSFGEFKPAVARLEKRIKKALELHKKRAKW